MSPYVCLLKRRRQTPFWTRPARPCRCLTLLLLHQCSCNRLRPRLSKPTSRSRPLSITVVTSGIVILVSAMLVLRITFVSPRGAFWNTACCAAGGRDECSGSTCRLAYPDSAECSCEIVR